jgi:hypothetical protein
MRSTDADPATDGAKNTHAKQLRSDTTSTPGMGSEEAPSLISTGSWTKLDSDALNF